MRNTMNCLTNTVRNQRRLFTVFTTSKQYTTMNLHKIYQDIQALRDAARETWPQGASEIAYESVLEILSGHGFDQPGTHCKQ